MTVPSLKEDVTSSCVGFQSVHFKDNHVYCTSKPVYLPRVIDIHILNIIPVRC